MLTRLAFSSSTLLVGTVSSSLIVFFEWFRSFPFNFLGNVLAFYLFMISLLLVSILLAFVSLIQQLISGFSVWVVVACWRNPGTSENPTEKSIIAKSQDRAANSVHKNDGCHHPEKARARHSMFHEKEASGTV